MSTKLLTPLVVALIGAGAARPLSATQSTSSSAVEAGFVEVPGSRIRYEVAGSGDVLVLIHGNAGDRRHWDRQFQVFARDFRVIRYDVRGYGRSSLPVEGEQYSNATDLLAVLDQLEVEKAHILGWSFGSGIAFDFVLAYPERTLSLTSVGPWAAGHRSPAVDALMEDMGAVSAAALRDGPESAVEAWMNSLFADTVRDPSASAEFERIAADYTWWAFRNASAARLLAPQAIERLGEIIVPVLIMTAEHDLPACLEIADRLDEGLPMSQKVLMEGTGHLMHIEKADEFNRHVVDFLSSVGSR